MEKNEVVVVDVQMPLWSMIVFMVKWAIASIPAMFALIFIAMLFVGMLRGCMNMPDFRIKKDIRYEPSASFYSSSAIYDEK